MDRQVVGAVNVRPVDVAQEVAVSGGPAGFRHWAHFERAKGGVAVEKNGL